MKAVREYKLRNPLEISLTKSSINSLTKKVGQQSLIKEVDSNEEKESSSNSNNELVVDLKI